MRDGSHDVSIAAPDDGELIELGPALVRLLGDGATTAHRLGIGEITLAPHSDGLPQVQPGSSQPTPLASRWRRHRSLPIVTAARRPSTPFVLAALRALHADRLPALVPWSVRLTLHVR
jgi:hypothetical protein